MYKKCDTIETGNEVESVLANGRLFNFKPIKLEKKKYLETDIDFSEMISKNIILMKFSLDNDFIAELKKHKIVTRKPRYIKMWLNRKGLKVVMTFPNFERPEIKIIEKEKNDGTNCKRKKKVHDRR